MSRGRGQVRPGQGPTEAGAGASAAYRLHSSTASSRASSVPSAISRDVRQMPLEAFSSSESHAEGQDGGPSVYLSWKWGGGLHGRGHPDRTLCNATCRGQQPAQLSLACGLCRAALSWRTLPSWGRTGSGPRHGGGRQDCVVLTAGEA